MDTKEMKVVAVEKAGPDTASPASYVMKYVMMSLDDEATLDAAGDEGERHRAWASSRGLRRMRLVGVHGSLRVWQRLWTSSSHEELPPRAAAARAAMRRSAEAGERAKGLPDGSPERLVARQEQAAAAAEALMTIGGLPGGDGRLTLGYEESETVYGRPVRKPVSIADSETGEEMPLRRQKAELISQSIKDKVTVTVVAIVPRDGAAPRPSDEERAWEAERKVRADQYEADLVPIIAVRLGLPQWEAWIAGKLEHLKRMREPEEDLDLAA